MALLAQLYGSGRKAERHVMSADATLRGDDQLPVDVFVADLSTTGCLFASDEALDLGAEITIGIAGLGRRQAKVVRARDQRYGCEFIVPLTSSDVTGALANSDGTVVRLLSWPLHDTADQEGMPHVVKLPGLVRLAVAIGAAGTLWSGIVGTIAVLR